MNALATMLVEHGPRLLLGVTLVLGLGALLTALVRDPKARRRSGLSTAVACALYLVAAAVPMPRIAFAASPAAEDTPPIPGAAMALALTELADVAPGPAPTTAAPRHDVPARPATTPAAPEAAMDLAPLLAVGYAIGSALAGAFWLFGACRLGQLLRRARPWTSPIALPVGVRLLVAGAAIRPFCCGIMRPTIVVPRSLLAPERRPQLTAVLRHEAAHAAARDPQAQALLAGLGVLLWCHPLFWWLAADVRFHAELCADDAAAMDRRTAYARELLDLADDAGPHTAMPGTVAVFRRPSDFTRRIQMLLQPKTTSPLPPSRLRRATQALALGMLTAAAAATFGVPLPAQDPQRAAMQAECDALRAEISKLKADLVALQQQAAVSSLNSLVASVQNSRDPLGRLLTDRDSKAIDNSPQLALRLGDAANGTLAPVDTQPAPNRLPDTQARTPGGEPTPAPAPDAAPADPQDRPATHGVPVLKDVPVLSNLFRTVDATAIPAGGAELPSSLEATADLASRVIDLDSEIDLARTELERLKPMAEAGVVGATELRRAEVQLRGLERKKAIVQKLVAGEIAATEAELQWLLRRKKGADKTEDLHIDGQLRRAAAKLEALRAVN